jgi:hypothetical protein
VRILEFEFLFSAGLCGDVLDFASKFRFAGVAMTGDGDLVILPNVRPAMMPQAAANPSSNESLVLFTKVIILYYKSLKALMNLKTTNLEPFAKAHGIS